MYSKFRGRNLDLWWRSNLTSLLTNLDFRLKVLPQCMLGSRRAQKGFMMGQFKQLLELNVHWQGGVSAVDWTPPVAWATLNSLWVNKVSSFIEMALQKTHSTLCLTTSTIYSYLLHVETKVPESCCPTSHLYGKKQWNCCNLVSDFVFFETRLRKKWSKRWNFELNSGEFTDRLEIVKKYSRKRDILNVVKWIIVSMWLLWVPYKAHCESKPSMFLLIIFYFISGFFLFRGCFEH